MILSTYENIEKQIEANQEIIRSIIRQNEKILELLMTASIYFPKGSEITPSDFFHTLEE